MDSSEGSNDGTLIRGGKRRSTHSTTVLHRHKEGKGLGIVSLVISCAWDPQGRCWNRIVEKGGEFLKTTTALVTWIEKVIGTTGIEVSVYDDDAKEFLMLEGIEEDPLDLFDSTIQETEQNNVFKIRVHRIDYATLGIKVAPPKKSARDRVKKDKAPLNIADGEVSASFESEESDGYTEVSTWEEVKPETPGPDQPGGNAAVMPMKVRKTVLRKRARVESDGFETRLSPLTHPETVTEAFKSHRLITVIDYNEVLNHCAEYDHGDDVISREMPSWARARWINFCWSDKAQITAVLKAYGAHKACIETATATQGLVSSVTVNEGETIVIFPHIFFKTVSAKVEDPTMGEYFEDMLGVPTLDDGSQTVRVKEVEFIVFVVLDNKVIITVQAREARTDGYEETVTQVFQPVIETLYKKKTELRKRRADMVMLELLDRIVNNLGHVSESMGHPLVMVEEKLDSDDEKISAAELNVIVRKIARVSQAFRVFRRDLFPMNEVLVNLRQDLHQTSASRAFVADISDQVKLQIEAVNTYLDSCNAAKSIADSRLDEEMNQVTKVLTVVTTIFVPMSFVAGVYGMNFIIFPETQWKNGYLFFWIVVLSMLFIQLLLFIKSKWLDIGTLGKAVMRNCCCCCRSIRCCCCGPRRRPQPVTRSPPA